MAQTRNFFAAFSKAINRDTPPVYRVESEQTVSLTCSLCGNKIHPGQKFSKCKNEICVKKMRVHAHCIVEKLENHSSVEIPCKNCNLYSTFHAVRNPYSLQNVLWVLLWQIIPSLLISMLLIQLSGVGWQFSLPHAATVLIFAANVWICWAVAGCMQGTVKTILRSACYCCCCFRICGRRKRYE